MSLGNKIRELRLQKQMTQKDVVGEFMTRNMLSKIENGSAAPSIRTLEYLADALGEPVGCLLDDAASEGLPDAAYAANLREIESLADQLLADTANFDVRCLSLCIKARAMLAQGNADGALSLLENSLSEEYPPENTELLYRACEECSTYTGDFRKAYLYATKRLELSK